jgi:hypothetical protein
MCGPLMGGGRQASTVSSRRPADQPPGHQAAASGQVPLRSMGSEQIVVGAAFCGAARTNARVEIPAIAPGEFLRSVGLRGRCSAGRRAGTWWVPIIPAAVGL